MKKTAGLEMAAGLILGAIAGNLVSKKLGETIPAVNKFSGAITGAAGFAIMGMKSPILKAAGAGMLAAGGASLAASFIPAVAPPISDEVLAEQIITEDIPLLEDLTGTEEIMAEAEVLNEDLTEDMTEDMN